ncbi:MAG: SDR family NAD(P)-dependent oxidoreductase [Bryobacteraceae bacterium]
MFILDSIVRRWAKEIKRNVLTPVGVLCRITLTSPSTIRPCTSAHKTALVTGAGKDVGKGIALELARHGCDIAVNYNRCRDGAEATAHEIREMGRRYPTAVVSSTR